MISLAATYSDLGRHQDALAMKEASLAFFRRVLPKDHPDIGEAYIAWTRRSLSGYGVL
jgi:hypothetical protein